MVGEKGSPLNRVPIPPTVISGPVSESALHDVLRSLKPGQELTVVYVGQGKKEGDDRCDD